MRLWPYQMLDVLPYRHLLSQWRECLAVAGTLKSKGELSHSTINRILDYPIEHFFVYCDLVRIEFARREWTIGENTLEKLKNDINYHCEDLSLIPNIDSEYSTGLYSVFNNEGQNEGRYNKIVELKDGSRNILFNDFHNDRYIKQCYYKLQEFYDTSALTEEIWNKIYIKFKFLGLEK